MFDALATIRVGTRPSSSRPTSCAPQRPRSCRHEAHRPPFISTLRQADTTHTEHVLPWRAGQVSQRKVGSKASRSTYAPPDEPLTPSDEITQRHAHTLFTRRCAEEFQHAGRQIWGGKQPIWARFEASLTTRPGWDQIWPNWCRCWRLACGSYSEQNSHELFSSLLREAPRRPTGMPLPRAPNNSAPAQPPRLVGRGAF